MQILKAEKLANVRYDVRGPVLDAANELEAQGYKILKLNIGNTGPFGYQTPQAMVDAMREALPKAEGYSDSKGIMPARQAAYEYCVSKGIPNITVDDVYIGNGASELITLSLNALLNAGDEILVPAPDYPLWTASVNLAGGKAVHYLCDEASDWMPDVEDIKKKISSRTRGIVIINPNNPTGAVYSEDVLKEIVEIARQNKLVLFSDEIYDRIIYDGGTHTSTATFAPDLLCLTFNGLSKAQLACGFRAGWMCISGDKSGAADYIAGINLLTSMRLCPNVPAQFTIAPALKDAHSIDPLLAPGGRLYEQRKAVVEAVDKIDGLSIVPAKASLYMFPKIDAKRFGIVDDQKFVLDFLKAKQVLFVPGSGFNWPAPDHFRIVFLPEAQVLTEAMNRLGEFLETYHQ